MEQQWRTYTFRSTWSIYPAEFLPQTSCLSFKAKWKHQGNPRDRFFKGHGVCSPSMCVNTEEPQEEPAKPLLYAIAWGCFWFLFVSVTSSLGKLENLCLFCSSAKGWGLVHEHPLWEPRQDGEQGTGENVDSALCRAVICQGQVFLYPATDEWVHISCPLNDVIALDGQLLSAVTQQLSGRSLKLFAGVFLAVSVLLQSWPAFHQVIHETIFHNHGRM